MFYPYFSRRVVSSFREEKYVKRARRATYRRSAHDAPPFLCDHQHHIFLDTSLVWYKQSAQPPSLLCHSQANFWPVRVSKPPPVMKQLDTLDVSAKAWPTPRLQRRERVCLKQSHISSRGRLGHNTRVCSACRCRRHVHDAALPTFCRETAIRQQGGTSPVIG